MIEETLIDTRKNRKILFLYLMHEILNECMVSNKGGINFVKSFGNKLRSIFNQLA